MSGYPMVESVNQLVANRLAGGGDLFLPGVGSLYPDRRGARRISRRKIEPPCRFVAYVSQERGVSLVDEIARGAECDAAQAQDIYNRWLAAVRHGDALRVDGVGELKFKSFTLDPVFDALLNPQGHLPISVQSSGSDWVVWFGVVAIIAAGAIVGSQLLTTDIVSRYFPWVPGTQAVTVCVATPEESRPRQEAQPLVSTPEPIVSDLAAPESTTDKNIETPSTTPTAVRAPEAVVVSKTDAAPATEQAVPQARAGAAESPTQMTAGRRYVVLGVYSTTANAARAITEAKAINSSLEYKIYVFGTKYMVSPFDAADAESCDQFMTGYRADFPTLWKHTAR